MMQGVPMTHKKPPRALFISQLLAFLLWGGTVCWLSLTANPPQFTGFMGWDKLQHACAYGLLSLLIAQFLHCLSGPLSLRAWWLAILTAVVCGGLAEVLQWQMQAGRVAEWGDLLANALGACFSCVLFRQVNLLKARRVERPVDRHKKGQLGELTLT